MNKLTLETINAYLNTDEGKKSFSNFVQKENKNNPEKDDPKPEPKKDDLKSKKDGESSLDDKIMKAVQLALKDLMPKKEEDIKDELDLDLTKLLKDTQEKQKNKEINEKELSKKQDKEITEDLARRMGIDPKTFDKEQVGE